ncbi:MAG TPA: glycosyltransferase, partial [Bacteroidota bacterium]|nr:glycosyltransferase [Bacteroidota bacterium]
EGCERIFVPSLPILDDLWDRGLRRLEHLPHGVDTAAFRPSSRSFPWREARGIRGEKFLLLYAGRLVWEKDLRTLARAYHELRQKRSDFMLALAGDGPIRRELEEMMPGALFLGHLGQDDLATAYASSDLFVFPSTTETFGNVILEAMASGVPPICAREGGAPGIVQHNVTGLLTAPRDPSDLASAIEQLLDNPVKREAMILHGLEFANRQSWQSIFLRMLDSYADVLESTKEHQPPRRRKAA